MKVSSSQLRRKAATLVSLRTPSASIYQCYKQKTDRWLLRSLVRSQAIRINDHVLLVCRAWLHRSVLFDSDYLVIAVERSAFRRARPGCDGMAVRTTSASTPPLVVLPKPGRRHRESALSILEHEIVHVNQMLTHAFPSRSGSRQVAPRLKHFSKAMRVEYEANLIQLVRWPNLFPQDAGLSLDLWCSLRGYVSALEETIAATGEDGLSSSQAVKVIQAVESRLEDLVLASGIEGKHMGWFAERWPAHSGTAISRVFREMPLLAKTEAIRGLAHWWTSRYGRKS